jgi:hypothetical protein
MNETEKMHYRPTRKADEVDAFSKVHTAHRYRPGQSSRDAVKARYNRRTRRTVRQAIRSGRV